MKQLMKGLTNREGDNREFERAVDAAGQRVDESDANFKLEDLADNKRQSRWVDDGGLGNDDFATNDGTHNKSTVPKSSIYGAMQGMVS